LFGALVILFPVKIFSYTLGTYQIFTLCMFIYAAFILVTASLKKEDIAKIFQPFEQVENSSSRKFHGTGLGLSLTKSLVELHGDTLWAESEGAGLGSTFSFTLPI
jgi:sensor histidine kinase regulating citrate/malate metabolism